MKSSEKRGIPIFLAYLLIIIISLNYTLADTEACAPGIDCPEDPSSIQYFSPSEISQLDSSFVIQNFAEIKSSGQAKFLTGKQLASVDKNEYGDLGQYDVLAITDAFTLQGFSVFSLKGSFSGAHIVQEDLVLADGSTFNLKTGKPITLETSGEGVKYFSDGETTCLNCIGLTVTQDSIKIKIADSITYGGATATKVKDFDGKNADKKDADKATSLTSGEKTFSLATSDQIIIGSTILNKLIATTFTTQNNQIKSAILFTSQNNNAFTLFCNGIPFDTVLSQQQSIHMNCTTVDAKKVEWFGLFTKNDVFTNEPTKISLATKKENKQISFTNSENEAFYTITDLKIFDVQQGELNFTTDLFTEQLISTCQASSAQIGSEGFTKVILAPTITLCQGARYNFLDKTLKESSFSLLNSGIADYIIGFQKGILFQVFLEQTQEEQWGFIEDNSPQRKTTLSSVIQYDRILSRKDLLMSEETYKSTALPFQPVYESFDAFSRAFITYDNEKITLAVQNYKPTAQIIAKVHSGFFTFAEENKGEKIELFFTLNKNARMPDYITEYKRFFITEKPTIFIKDKTVIAKANNTNGKETEVRIYTPETSAWSTVRAWFFAVASEKLPDLIQALSAAIIPKEESY